MILRPQFPPDVYPEGKAIRQSIFARHYPGPRAVLNELERMASSYGPACDQVRQNLAIAEGQIRDYQARFGKPFIYDDYLSDLTGLVRDQLKAGLSGAPHTEGKEGPSVSELAARVKAIRAAHTVDATPERARQKHSTAEEPITARIRRRTNGLQVSDRAPKLEARSSIAPATEPRESMAQTTARDIAQMIPADQASTQDRAIRPELSF